MSIPSLFCEFIYRNEYEVQCPQCGRSFSGTPERYAGRIVCASRVAAMDGPGTDLEAIFQWWADKFRKVISTSGCSGCSQIKLAMNYHGKDWVRENIELLIKSIQANAQSQDIRIPSQMIRRWLRKVSAD